LEKRKRRLVETKLKAHENTIHALMTGQEIWRKLRSIQFH